MKDYPAVRMRRLRATEGLRRMLSAPVPGPEKMVWPVFVVDGQRRREPIDALPGQFRFSVDELLRALEPVVADGVGGVLLFGVPGADDKTPDGRGAWNQHGVVQEAARAMRKAFPNLVLMTDVCLCAYTDHGHCGVLDADGGVANDATNELLARVALSHAEAGSQIVAPSAMMDGQVAAIRRALDEAGLGDRAIMSYSTKFASSLYGPFREAEQSAPKSGDRRGYQAPYGDARQALRESALDEQEGADILMIKPSLFYLDLLVRLRAQTELPLAAYNVSGEYAMLCASAERGWGDLRGMVRESLTALTRAGADLILTYWANRYRDLVADA